MEARTLEEHMLPENERSSAMPKSLYDYKRIEDMSSDRYVSMLMKMHQDGNFGINLEARAYNGCSFSITGGYCRNHLLGVETITDIDVVTNSPDEICQALSRQFFQVPNRNRIVKTYTVPDNTLQVLPYGHIHIENGVGHVGVEPSRFDFTVNLACISAVNGCLYAPPVTMFDIKNKILRPCTQPYSLECYGPANVMILSVILRAIRFSLKYDMAIHESILRAMDILFTIQNETRQVDDVNLYHCLKGLRNDSPELRERFYNTLRALRFIETNQHDTFDDYFRHVEARFKSMVPRQPPVSVDSPRSSY